MILSKKLFDQATENENKVILRKIKDIATPYTSSLKEPTPVIAKGRPSKSENQVWAVKGRGCG